MGAHRLRLILITAAAALVLGLGSTAALAAFAEPGGPRRGIPAGTPWSCAAPELTGTVVDVTLAIWAA